MNGEMNFTFLTGLRLGLYFAIGISR
jgi:hypothetical protein